LRSTLIEAIEAGEEQRALAILSEHPEEADARTDKGMSALLLALYRGQAPVAEAIRDARDEIDVFEAAALGQAETLRRLVRDSGARVSEWSPDGFTALHYAAFFGHLEATTVLVEAGADIEARARNQQFAADARPLHSAAAAGEIDICALLLDAGADVNAQQHGGFTPLLEAAQQGDAALAALLLRRGADPSITLSDGRSAADLAAEARNEKLAKELRSK
jgi:ankyrin repeat protein